MTQLASLSDDLVQVVVGKSVTLVTVQLPVLKWFNEQSAPVATPIPKLVEALGISGTMARKVIHSLVKRGLLVAIDRTMARRYFISETGKAFLAAPETTKIERDQRTERMIAFLLLVCRQPNRCLKSVQGKQINALMPKDLRFDYSPNMNKVSCQAERTGWACRTDDGIMMTEAGMTWLVEQGCRIPEPGEAAPPDLPLQKAPVITPSELPPALQELVAALSDGSIFDMNGSATAVFARMLGIDTAALTNRVSRAVSRGVLAAPLVMGKRTYEYRLPYQASRASELRQPKAAAAMLPSSLGTIASHNESPRPTLLKSTEVVPAPMRMLWRGRLPQGVISVIAGEPGKGKSTLMATISAELSRQGITSIIASQEDNPSTVIRPRLDVAGADLERVHLISEDTQLVFPEHLEVLRGMINDTGAKLVSFDPFSGYFGSDRAMHKRQTLMELAKLARELNCAILGLHHTIKGDGKTAIELLGGPTSGLSGAARAVYLYGNDPNDCDRRALGCVKVNGFEMPATLTIEHTTVDYRGTDGAKLQAGRLKIRREINASARSLMYQGRINTTRDQECAEWLTELLVKSDFTLEIPTVRLAAESQGFSWPTVLRVSVALEIEKSSVGDDNDSIETWSLAPDHPLRQVESDDTAG
jgi:predicted transcriptional regulator